MLLIYIEMKTNKKKPETNLVHCFYRKSWKWKEKKIADLSLCSSPLIICLLLSLSISACRSENVSTLHPTVLSRIKRLKNSEKCGGRGRQRLLVRGGGWNPTNYLVESDVTNLYEPYLIISPLHFSPKQYRSFLSYIFFSLFSLCCPSVFPCSVISFGFDLTPSPPPPRVYYSPFLHCYTQTNASVHNRGFFFLGPYK
jgi:hypothetical protein